MSIARLRAGLVYQTTKPTKPLFYVLSLLLQSLQLLLDVLTILLIIIFYHMTAVY